MILKDWMHLNKIKQNKLAKDLSINPCHVSSLIQGRRKPSKMLARDIFVYTRGRVTPRDFGLDYDVDKTNTPRLYIADL